MNDKQTGKLEAHDQEPCSPPTVPEELDTGDESSSDRVEDGQGGHTHTMTEEYYEDMKALAAAAEGLDKTGPEIKVLVDKVNDNAKLAEEAITAVRNLIQPTEESPKPTNRSLGLWAAGLGNFALSSKNKLKDNFEKDEIAKAGEYVNNFFIHLTRDDGCGSVLLSLIELALAEDEEQRKIPSEARKRIEHLHTKIFQMMGRKKFVPPYLWPSTYVSSSSSAGYSSSSSSWPPPPR